MILPRRHALLPLLAVPLVLPGLTAPARAAASRARVGEVRSVSGIADAHHPDEAPRVLTAGTEILLADLLVTGADSRLACRLEGGIDLRLGANASLRVDALTLRGPRAGIALRAAGGPLLFERASPPPSAAAGPAVAPPPTTVSLPWARIGVRGTRFFAGPFEDALSVFVAEGRVVVQPTVAGAPRLTLGAGEGIDLPSQPVPGGVPTVPPQVRRWAPARIARALALVQ